MRVTIYKEDPSLEDLKNKVPIEVYDGAYKVLIETEHGRFEIYQDQEIGDLLFKWDEDAKPDIKTGCIYFGRI
jgi:hypothetical protein